MPEERFSNQVAEVLRAAGWQEGRDIGAQAEEQLRRAIEAARTEGRELEAFPAIRAALHEFGGLTVTKEAVGAFNGYDFRIDSSLQVRGFGIYEEIAKVVGGRVFPLGIEPDEHSSLAMAENGEVYLLHFARDCYVGASMDAALDALIDMKAVLPDLSDYYDFDLTDESGRRFNEQVTGIVLGAGWTLGRDLGAAADEMIARVVADAPALGRPLEAFPAAVAAVHEFGGLSFTKEALADETGFDGADLVIDPSAGMALPEVRGPLERAVGRSCFPLARDLEFDSTLWIDTDGRVFQIYSDDQSIALVGETVDKALTAWLQDLDFTNIDAAPSDEQEG